MDSNGSIQFQEVEEVDTAEPSALPIDIQPGKCANPEMQSGECVTPESDIPYLLPIDDQRRAEYLDLCVPLYQATINGEWEVAEGIINQHKRIVRAAITSKWETALHVAAAAKHKGFVKNLLTKMDRKDLALKNKDNNTAICFAAASGVVDIAKMMVDMNGDLPLIRGNGGMTPLYMAALFGHRKMVLYLYEETDFDRLTRAERINLFHVIISADIYDVALRMLERHPSLATSRNQGGETALHLMARKPSEIASRSHLGFLKRSINSVSKGIFHKDLMRALAHQLVEKLWKQVIRLPERKVSELIRQPSRLLFDAAASGNVEFLVILIRSYPDLIWKMDNKNRSLFHVAAMNRHENVFNIIYELGAIKDVIASYKEDQTRSNMLHLVASLPPPERLQIVSGAALQMQRELLWFKAVKNIVPHSYIKMKNSKGELAQELFTEGHRKLREEGEKWMKDTATSCMLVATLIATVVFAAAFTVPGGNDNTTGKPILQTHKTFNIFIISDAVALFSSSTSIVIFLSILTSRYAESDFLISLPSRLMLGLLALFISIISMVLAFVSALLLIHDHRFAWISILIIVLACVTTLAFAVLHVRLWFDTLRSAYWSKFLFLGHRHRIYHQRYRCPSWLKMF